MLSPPHLLKGDRRRALGHWAGRLRTKIVGLRVYRQPQVLDEHVDRAPAHGAAWKEAAAISEARGGGWITAPGPLISP